MVLLAGAAAAILAVVPAGAAPPSLTAKQQQAQQIELEINRIDSTLEKAIERYDYATLKLGSLTRELKTNTRDLGIVRANLTFAQRSLEQRLVALYQQGEQTPTLGILLGSANLDDFISKMDTASRVSGQDALLLRQVRRFRAEVKARESFLQHARADQAQIVKNRAAEKASIESQLQARQRYLASVKDEIAKIQAQEAARQLQLAREAQARLARQGLSQNQYLTDVGTPVTDPATAALAQLPPPRYSGVVGIAMQYLGTPYVWGGSEPGGFDCSGFTSFVFAQEGVSLPHYAAAQYNYGTPVPRDQLAPGDLVFFDGLGHVGLYIGGGDFIHSPHTGDVVKISSLSDPWYAATYVGARRIG